MIVFVDIEHESTHSLAHGERLLAARSRITYRLEDLSGLPCMLVRYNKLTTELIERLDAKALFLSGNSAVPDRYQADELETFFDVLRSAEIPMFGFCGGMQFLALALGVEVVPLPAELAAPEPPEKPTEFGYLPITITDPHPTLEGLGEHPVFRHAHRLHVPEPPPGFTVHANTDITAVQLMANEDRKIVATQFHPEYYTDEAPAGRLMIENFLRWAEV